VHVFLKKECTITLKSHPSSILAQFESAYGTSYWSSVVTLILSCTVLDILELCTTESHFFHTLPLSRPIFWGCFLWHQLAELVGWKLWNKISVLLVGSAKSETLTNIEIIFEVFQLSDHDASMLWTDRQLAVATQHTVWHRKVISSSL